MNFEISRDSKNGAFRLSFKRHVFVSAGLVLLAGGLAALTGPWWLPLAEAVLGGAGLPIRPSYQWMLGGTLSAIGLALLGYKHYGLDKAQKRLEADRQALAPLIPQIGAVREYLKTLGDDHSYRSSSDSIFVNWLTRHLEPELALQDQPTATRYKQFASVGARLHSFVGRNFWKFPRDSLHGDDYRYCMWPHYNIDREMLSYDKDKALKYDQFAEELAALLRETELAFDGLVERLNKCGHVPRTAA